MRKQPPDFTKLFFKSLGGVPSAIDYALRNGPNLLHDLAFVNSLLHDAHVLNPAAKPVNGAFKIRFQRDCWELGFGQPGSNDKYRTVRSSLVFRGVRKVDWRKGPRRLTDYALDHCWITRMYRSHTARQFPFELVGFGWLCRVWLASAEWSIELHDLGKPRKWKPKQR